MIVTLLNIAQSSRCVRIKLWVFVTFRLKEVKSMKVKNKTKYVPQDSFYVFAIEYLGIDSAYQRQGIGTKLLILMFRTAVTTII